MELAMNSNENPRFWQLRQYSLILAENKLFKRAISVAKKSLKMAKKSGNENYIKITSLTGEVIIELETFAGGFSWNLISADGNKISPGIYLVFLISQNGDENLINKILVL